MFWKEQVERPQEHISHFQGTERRQVRLDRVNEELNGRKMWSEMQEVQMI